MSFTALTVVTFVLSASLCAQSPFAGTWKQNRQKTQFDPSTNVLTIEPFEQGVRFSTASGPIYSGALDDTERPGLGASASDTFRLKKIGDRGYEASLLRNGKVVLRDRVEASTDEKTLIRSLTIYNRKDGSGTTDVFTHTRTSGEPTPFPFIGSWTVDRTLTKWGSEPIPLMIAESGGVLTWSDPVTNNRATVDLDKSTVTQTGDNLATDLKQTVKKVNERTLERGFARGPLTGTSVYAVSADGKAMTVRSTTIGTDGMSRTNTFFYDRQQ